MWLCAGERCRSDSGLVSPRLQTGPAPRPRWCVIFNFISSTSPQLSFLLQPLVERRARAPPAPLHAPKHRHAQQHRARGGHSSKDMMMRTQQQPSSRRASSFSLSRMLLRKAFPIAAVLLLVSVLINIRFTTSLMMSTTTRRDLLALSSSSAEHRRMMARRTNLHARTNQNAMPTSVERLPHHIHGENNSQSFHSRAYATLLTTAHSKSMLKYIHSRINSQILLACLLFART